MWGASRFHGRGTCRKVGAEAGLMIQTLPSAHKTSGANHVVPRALTIGLGHHRPQPWRSACGYSSWSRPRSPRPARAIVRGLFPVHRLKARENEAGSEKPTR